MIYSQGPWLTVENNLTLYGTPYVPCTQQMYQLHTENDTHTQPQQCLAVDWEGGWLYNLRVYSLTRIWSENGSIFSSFTLNVIIDPNRDVRSYQDLKRVNIGICDAYDPDNCLNSTKA